MFGRSFFKISIIVCLWMAFILLPVGQGRGSEVAGTYIGTDPQGPAKLLVFDPDGGGFTREGEALTRFDWEVKDGEVWLGLLDGRSNPLRIFKVESNRLIGTDSAGEIYKRD